jgi:hypothetical protein
MLSPSIISVFFSGIHMDKNKMMYLAIGVLAVIAAVGYIYVSQSSNANVAAYYNKPVEPSVLATLNQIAANNTLANQVGLGLVATYPTVINSTPLVLNGTPTVIYVGAEYCPYCAITRWGMVIALMRFGNLSSLHYMASSPTDIYPNTPTFTFFNSSYSSNYIKFLFAETENQTGAPLMTPTPLESKVFAAYDLSHGIPFIDFGNRSVIDTAIILPVLLKGLDWQQAITEMQNPSTSVSQGIIGEANLMTAKICSIDNFTPASVCSQPYVGKILNKSGG